MAIDGNIIATVVVSMIVGVLSATVTLFLGVKNLRNQNAGGDKSISEAWQTLIAPMQNRIADQEKEILALQDRVDALEMKDGVSQTVILGLNKELIRERAIKDLYRTQLYANNIEPMAIAVEHEI